MINKLLAIIINEWLLILRDRMGLLILFGLPICLVIVMSLMQANLDNASKAIHVALINLNSSKQNLQLSDALEHSDYYTIHKIKADSDWEAQVKRHLLNGDYQAMIVLPDLKKKPQASLYIDPTIPVDLANGITLATSFLLQQNSLQSLENTLKKQRLPKARKQFPIIKLKHHYITPLKTEATPNTAQQNIPAWSLFGMFFIVVPLASQMLRERSEGIEQRLALSLVSPWTRIFGRNIAYVTLNMVQLVSMFMVGLYIMPLFGVSGLTLSGKIGMICLTGLVASFTATGFGLCVGAGCQTQQQVSSVGPFIIVIMAAISGIFVPSYLMPDSMILLSQVSPMYWSQQAFLDVLVRGKTYHDLLPWYALSAIFYIMMLILTRILLSLQSKKA